jgi:hypothetical protein
MSIQSDVGALKADMKWVKSSMQEMHGKIDGLENWRSRAAFTYSAIGTIVGIVVDVCFGFRK